MNEKYRKLQEEFKELKQQMATGSQGLPPEEPLSPTLSNSPGATPSRIKSQQEWIDELAEAKS